MNDPAFKHNQQILEDLEWAIATNDGEFELLLVRYDYILLREKFLEQWRKITSLQLLEIKLGLGDYQALKKITTELQTFTETNQTLPKALVIYRFESSQNPEAFFAGLNQSRDELKKNCPFPVVFLVGSQSQDIFAKQAQDLKNWSASATTLKMPWEWLPEDLENKFQNFVDLYITEGQDQPTFFDFWMDHYRGGKSLALELDGITIAIENNQIQLTEQQQGYLALLQGWRYRKDNPQQSEEYYQQAIHIFSGTSHWKRAIAELCLGELLQKKNPQAAKTLLQNALVTFEQSESWSFWRCCAVLLGRILRSLGQWTELKLIAAQLIESETRLNYITEQTGEGHIFLAQYFLEKQEYAKAIDEISQSQADGHEELEIYGIFAAIAHEHLGEHDASWEAWLRVLEYSDTYDVELDYFFGLVEQLHDLYFENQHFVDAYQVKLEWRSLEYQYGRIAFVGAGRLKPVRRLIFNDRQDEFAASGRQEDVQLIMDRLSRPKHKLTILYGQSGVGKSSMIDAGLLPALERKKFINGRDLLPFSVIDYRAWQENFKPDMHILETLKHFVAENRLVILIFDQFEEFFFQQPEPKEQRRFFEFFRDCLNIPFVKVILSLREDYLYLLLQGTRNLDLSAIDNNLLHRDILHYIGNFSPNTAKNVIQFLIDNSKVNFSDELIDIFVEDLTTELGEVRPIELQIVGQQIQRDIRTKEQYLDHATAELSPKEVLIDQYLEAAIKDCGEPNEQIARLILYYLTDEDEHKVLKSLAELENDLVQWQEKFPIKDGQISETVNILVLSGLVVEILEPEVSQYQLVHDYLIRPIRKSQTSTMEELQQALQTERQKNLSLVEQNRNIEQKITDGERRLKRASVGFNLAVGLGTLFILGTGLWSTWQINEAEKRQALSSLGTKLEREASLAVNIFTFRPLEGFLMSVKTGDKLLKTVKKESISNINQYPAIRPMSSINELLNKTKEQFTENNQLRGHESGVRSVSFSPDGETLASASEDGTVRLWNRSGDELQVLRGHESWVWSVSFSPDGETLASASSDGTVRLWNRSGDELQVLRGHESGVLSVSFSPDGETLASASDDGTVRLWNRSGDELQVLRGHESLVLSVSFSPDGETLASASDDGTVRLWNRSGEELQVLRGHESLVLSVSFSPDGETLASASEDGTVRLWPVESLEDLLVRGCAWLEDYLRLYPEENKTDEGDILCEYPPR